MLVLKFCSTSLDNCLPLVYYIFENYPLGGFKMFAKRLLLLMDKNNYKQSDLADLLGLTRGAVSKMINEGGTPSVETLRKLRKIFNVSIDYLLGLDIEDIMDALDRHNFAEIAAKIKKIREDKNLTQKEFARYNDIDTRDVIDLENEKATSIDVLQKISFYSGVGLYELMGEPSHPLTTHDIEYKNILKFAADLGNKEFMEIAMAIKESGVSPDDIVIARKIN